MASTITAQHIGSLQVTPIALPQTFPSLADGVDTGFSRNYAFRAGGGPQPASGTTVLGFGGITNARFLYLRVAEGQTVNVRITSAAGATQAIPVSDFLMWSAPRAGDEATAIDLQGTADFEYLLLGD